MVSVRLLMAFMLLISSGYVQAALYSTQSSACLAHAEAISHNAYSPYQDLGYYRVCTDEFANKRLKECVSNNGGATCNVFQQYWYYEETVCNSPQVLQLDHSCACPAGQILDGGQCVPECPVGKVKASTLSQLFTSSDACVDPSIERCDALGYNPNDITPACSQLFQGSPAVCFQSEYPETQLPQCPELTCEDGSTVTYPLPCPVISCPEGFTLASLGADLGNSCIKELPPEDQPNPDEACITVPGVGSETICADANNTQCGRYNGEYVCLEKKDSPEPGDYCIDKNGTNICLTNQPRINETYERTNNPDGSYEETVRRETNIQGDAPSTTTRSCDASGNCVTTSTDTSKEQNLASLKAIEKNTRETADLLSEFRDALKAPESGFSGETASGDEEQLYQKTDKTMQSVYSSFLTDIQTQPLYQAVQTAFVASFSSCGCPVFETGNISMMGATFNFRFDQFCSDTFNNLILPTVQAVIGILAALVAIKFAFL